MAEKTVYDLELHEQTTLLTNPKNTEVLRVPGGWIYFRNYKDSVSSTFVPFSDNPESKYNSEEEEPLI